MCFSWQDNNNLVITSQQRWVYQRTNAACTHKCPSVYGGG